MALIGECDAFVTNDSGLMHIAAALHTQQQHPARRVQARRRCAGQECLALFMFLLFPQDERQKLNIRWKMCAPWRLQPSRQYFLPKGAHTRPDTVSFRAHRQNLPLPTPAANRRRHASGDILL